MMKYDDFEAARFELRRLQKKLQTAAEIETEGLLSYRRYPNGTAVPYLVSGSRGSRKRIRLDPDDKETIALLRNKTVALKALPLVEKDLEALEKAKDYREINLDMLCHSLGPEFAPCADLFLGRKNGHVPNPAFDCLKERQNTFPFDRSAITT